MLKILEKKTTWLARKNKRGRCNPT